MGAMDNNAQSSEIFYASDAYGLSQREWLYLFVATAGGVAGLCTAFQCLGSEELSEKRLTLWKRASKASEKWLRDLNFSVNVR